MTDGREGMKKIGARGQFYRGDDSKMNYYIGVDVSRVKKDGHGG